MQFFYRIFRKNKVLLRKRKIPITSQRKADSLCSPLSTLAAATTYSTTTSSSSNSGVGSGGETKAGNGTKRIKMDVPHNNSTTRYCPEDAAVSSSTEKCYRENQALSMSASVGKNYHSAQSQLRHHRPEPKPPKKVDFPGNKQGQFFDSQPQPANCGRQIDHQILLSSPSQQQPRHHETINVTAKDVKQILEELKEKTAAATDAAVAKVDVDRRLPASTAPCIGSNQQRKGPQTTQASANSVTSKISQEQKLAIRNFRLGSGQQAQQSLATSATESSVQGDSEKILSIVSNLHKKQVAKQQQQQNCGDSVPQTVSDGASTALSPKTTIQKTTVSSIQLGTMKNLISAPSGKTSDAMSSRVNKAASLVVQNQQPVSAVSAMERHLAKTLPSGTAVTVKVAAAAAARASGATSNDKPYNNKDGIITPIIKKDALSCGPRTDSVRKSLSDRSFINVSEALMKQKAVLSSASVGSGMPGQQQMPIPRPTMSAMFKTAMAANVMRGNSTPPPRTSGVVSLPTANAPSATMAMRNQFPAAVVATTPPPPPPSTNASTVVAAFSSLSAAVAANPQSPQLGAMTVANLDAAPTTDSLGIQTQIPKKRLEVKLQQPSVTHSSLLSASSAVLPQPQQVISFRKQPPVAELLWSGPPVTSAAAANIVLKDATGGTAVGPRKTLNQGIRQIPNPSLLTNKQKNGTGIGDGTGTTE